MRAHQLDGHRMVWCGVQLNTVYSVLGRGAQLCSRASPAWRLRGALLPGSGSAAGSSGLGSSWPGESLNTRVYTCYAGVPRVLLQDLKNRVYISRAACGARPPAERKLCSARTIAGPEDGAGSWEEPVLFDSSSAGTLGNSCRRTSKPLPVCQ
jgi:hypothetical protein